MNPKLELIIYHHRPRITLLLAVAVIGWATPTPESLAWGALIIFLGAVGRTWASGYIEKNEELATSGPYRFSRNPLYVFNLIMFIGYCVMSANVWVGLAAAAGFTFIYIPIIRREAANMQRFFGNQSVYHQWVANVPLFFPRMTPYGENRKSFSWRLVFDHHEHHHWPVMVLAAGIFIAIYYYQSGAF
jgi:protein-S-isoprenylcysteine O-methyltransferase Ste14